MIDADFDNLTIDEKKTVGFKLFRLTEGEETNIKTVKKITAKICKVASFIFVCGSLVMGYVVYARMQMPYNEVGRYYDSENQVVWHEQAIMVYILFAVGFALASVLLIFLAKRMRRNST